MSPPEAPPLVRIHLRYPDETVFVQRFAPNVTRGGIFLASRTPQPVGTYINFEVCLMQGPALLWGSGKVTWVREFNPQEPQRAHGMGVQFRRVAPECRPLLDRLFENKVVPSRSTPSGGIPVPLPQRPSERSGSAEIPLLDGPPENWIDDQGLRNAIARARVLASGIEDVESLRRQDQEEPPTLDTALAGLKRMFGPKPSVG